MKNEIVSGSISDVMKRDDVSLAESFLSCDCVILIDVSGSMDSRDGGNRTRFDRACDELRKLQAALPGKIAVVQFSSKVQFMPGGMPVFENGGTDLTTGLEFIRAADVPDMRFVVISDGEPNNEITAMAEARKFSNRIDTVFIGSEDGYGREFLQRLASESGGSAIKTASENIKSEVMLLLGRGV